MNNVEKDTVTCKTCGMKVKREEAIQEEDEYYCSEACAEQAEAA